MATKITRTNSADNIRKISEGRLSSDSIDQSFSPTSTFVRMIVMDVVVDPNKDLTDKEKINSWHGMGVSNMQYANVVPRNTIIAKRVGEEVDPMFVFPFFPSHLALPCKPGECVWVMLEKPDVPNSDMAFWFSRVAEPHVSDDVNHSHPGRSFESSLSPTTKERAENEQEGTAESGDNVYHELRNGPVVEKSGKRLTSGEAIILRGEEEDIFERLILESSASEYMTYESVPRFRKRPGDLALEGTNNTLLVLGTDRSGSLGKSKYEAGSIDIVAGRGQIEDTFGVEAKTTSITKLSGEPEGFEIKKELNKTIDVLKEKEGDPDFKNDRSRILVSQRTSVDNNFNLSGYNKEVLDSATTFNKEAIKDADDGDAAIVIKSDKVRFIARSDVEIIVTNYKETINEPGGNKKKLKDETSSNSEWASIVIKKNGDIILTPSEKGYLKLGGDDADLAVLCSKAVPESPGQVKGVPLVDTNGGTMGVPGNDSTGKFAKKVLIK